MRFRFTLNNTTEGQEVLSQEPKGWDKTEILFKRHSKYHGLFLDYSVKLEFYSGAGKEYIDEIYQTQGIDAEITILIELECDGAYETLYSGKLSLETWESFGNIGSRDSFTSVSIVEIGITQTLENRLNTKIDLTKLETIDGTSLTAFTYGPYEMSLHGKAIAQQSLRVQDDTVYNYSRVTSTLFGTGGDTDMLFSFNKFIESISEITGALLNADPALSWNDTLPTATRHIHTFATTETFYVNIDIDATLTDTCASARTFDLKLVYGYGALSNDNITTIKDFGSYSLAAGATTINVSHKASFTVPGTATEKFWIYLHWTSYTKVAGNTVTFNVAVDNSSISIYRADIDADAPSPCNVYGVHEAFSRVSQSLTNQTDAFRSNYFGRKNSDVVYGSNGCGAFTAITNGFQIRQFRIAEKPPIMSFEDLYKSMDAVHNLGMSVEVGGSGYVIRVEPKEYFYSNNVVLRLSNIPDMKSEVARDYFYNDISIGYSKWENEGINGLDEVNAKHEYNLGMKTIDRKLDVKSPFIASAYAIEYTRRQDIQDVGLVDYKYDNDNFIICLSHEVDGSGNPSNMTAAEKDENYDQVLNILSPSTAYNLRISPKRNLLRWSKVFNSSLLRYAGRAVKFTYGEGNYKMVSEFTSDSCGGNFNNVEIQENENMAWDNANNTGGASLWINEIIHFDYPLSFTDYKNIKANPTYCLEISRTNTDFIKAYILEIRYKPVNGMASFKLLRANA